MSNEEELERRLERAEACIASLHKFLIITMQSCWEHCGTALPNAFYDDLEQRVKRKDEPNS
jgi:hypothetical protein